MPRKKVYGEVLDVKKILENWDPFHAFGGRRVSESSVHKALAAGNFASEFQSWDNRKWSYHAQRIAYFVKHGWDEPISVDVGCGPLGGHFGVDDGNHRLCAAVIRGDASIKSSTGGLVDIIKEFEYKG